MEAMQIRALVAMGLAAQALPSTPATERTLESAHAHYVAGDYEMAERIARIAENHAMLMAELREAK